MLHKKLIAVCGAAALLTMFVAGPAMAAPGDLVVTGGALAFDGGAPTISSFDPITLTGVPQLTTLTVDPFTVVDPTGSAAGWNVTLQIPDLVNGGSSILSTDISMSAPTVTPVGTSDASLVTPTAVAAFTGSAGDEIVTAAADATTGGMYLVSPFPAKLVVPVDAITGTYTSAAVISINTGP